MAKRIVVEEVFKPGGEAARKKILRNNLIKAINATSKNVETGDSGCIKSTLEKESGEILGCIPK